MRIKGFRVHIFVRMNFKENFDGDSLILFEIEGALFYASI
jgi:hypothetical protein